MSRGATRGSGGGGGLGHRGWVQGGSALRLGSQLYIGMLVWQPLSSVKVEKNEKRRPLCYVSVLAPHCR